MQDREHESAQDKLARLTSYLDKNHSLYEFLSEGSWFKSHETDTIKKIRAEVEILKSKTATVNKPSSSTVTVDLPAWQSQFTDFSKIEIFLKRDPIEIIELLDKEDETKQTLRDFLYSQAKSKPFILYLMLNRQLVRDEDMASLDGLQKPLLEMMQHPDMPESCCNKLLADARNPRSAYHQFLCRVSDMKAQLLPRVTETPASLYPKLAATAFGDDCREPPPPYDQAVKNGTQDIEMVEMVSNWPSPSNVAPVRPVAVLAEGDSGGKRCQPALT